MPRFAANLSFLYNEVPFLDRFAAAAHDGFVAVEFGFGYDFVAKEIAARLGAHGLTQVLINAPPGDLAKGDRGLASLPGREHEFAASVVTALSYAQTLACPRVHIMAGVLPADADGGEINYRHIFALLDELNYHGWVGCEYRPLGSTSAGLGWMKTLLSPG